MVGAMHSRAKDRKKKGFGWQEASSILFMYWLPAIRQALTYFLHHILIMPRYLIF